MKIIGQDKTEHQAHRIEHNINKISIIPPKDKRRKILVGEYESLERAIEVFSEIAAANSRHETVFEMPEK